MNFPPPFRSLHSSLIIAFHYLPSPFITFHRLLSPFIAFHCLSSPPHLIVRPLSALPRFVLTLPRFVLVSPPFCPRLAPALSSPRPVLSSPRPALSPCPRIPPLHTCFPPASSPHLFHTSVFHAPLSALLCFASLFLLPLFYSLHCFYSLPLFTPSSLYLLPLFCTRFFTPRQPPQTRPRHRKRQRFSHFSKKFCKKPLTKQKKVLY